MIQLNEQLLAWAESYVGLREAPEDVNNAIIMEFARILAVPTPTFPADSQQWCGLFLAALAHANGVAKPTSYLYARSWLTVGMPVLNPIPGDICVLWTGTQDGRDGHVGLFKSQNPTEVFLLGGNQVDAVREYAYSKDRILGYRRLYRAPV
jgi:uncharacterized protein (TIGR02594 family)